MLAVCRMDQRDKGGDREETLQWSGQEMPEASAREGTEEMVAEGYFQ